MRCTLQIFISVCVLGWYILYLFILFTVTISNSLYPAMHFCILSCHSFHLLVGISGVHLFFGAIRAYNSRQTLLSFFISRQALPGLPAGDQAGVISFYHHSLFYHQTFCA